MHQKYAEHVVNTYVFDNWGVPAWASFQKHSKQKYKNAIMFIWKTYIFAKCEHFHCKSRGFWTGNWLDPFHLKSLPEHGAWAHAQSPHAQIAGRKIVPTFSFPFARRCSLENPPSKACGKNIAVHFPFKFPFKSLWFGALLSESCGGVLCVDTSNGLLQKVILPQISFQKSNYLKRRGEIKEQW